MGQPAGKVKCRRVAPAWSLTEKAKEALGVATMQVPLVTLPWRDERLDRKRP